MGLGSWPVWTLIAVVQLWWTPPSLPIPNYILLSRPNANIQPLHRTRLFPIHSPPSVPLILGKPLFEMCWFYGHCPPPLCQPGQHGKKVLQTILASLYTLGHTWEKSAPNHTGKPFTHTPPFGQCPFGKNTFQKGASLISFDIAKRPVWLKSLSFLTALTFVFPIVLFCLFAFVFPPPLSSFFLFSCHFIVA